MAVKGTDAAVVLVVRVRETQEYDIEVTATTADGGLEVARQARLKFLGMTVVEQSTNSVGVTSRVFEVEDEEFDDDEFAPGE
jgi:hypothetical protein